MIRKVLFGIFVVPIILILAFGAVNSVSAILSGNVSIASWVMDHRIFLALILCYVAVRFINNPWKTK